MQSVSWNVPGLLRFGRASAAPPCYRRLRGTLWECAASVGLWTTEL